MTEARQNLRKTNFAARWFVAYDEWLMSHALILLLLLPAESPDDAVRAAIGKGLRRLEIGSANYIKNRQCFSCHHQALTIAALQSARQRGFAVDVAHLQKQLDFTLETFRPKLDRVAKGEAVPGASTMAAYALFTLEAAGHGADASTEAIVDYLLVRQKPDGVWPALMSRPPSEGSSFTNNALALRALKKYATAKQRDRAEKAFAKGRDWLVMNKPATTEDRMFHLRGLIAGGVEEKTIVAARDALLAEQREDGSWAQLPELAGDAYATGAMLMALRQAGVKSDSAAYRKGLAYLVKTQKDDGSWLVTTRSRPVQVFFDNGDPGGKSQFISFAATGWAVLALLEACPVKSPGS